MLKRRRGVVGAALVAAFLLLTPVVAAGHAWAQAAAPALNLTTSPLPIDLEAKPGQTISADLRVKNSGTATEKLQVNLLKFGASNQNGQPKLADREPGDTYFDWVTFSEKQFTAEPNVWHDIKMTIKIPPTAGLGYYYAVVFSRATAPDATPTGASIQGGAATLVLLDVASPNAKREIKLTGFTSKKRIYEFLPASFTVTLQNSGNIHLAPSGTIFITKGSGDNSENDGQLATLDVNVTHGNILPDSIRFFPVNWNDGFPSYQQVIKDGKVVNGKHGEAKQTLKWDLGQASKLRFGKYTAHLLVVYDDGQKDVPLEATLTFWVIPWRILGVALLVLLLLAAGLFSIIRKIWKGARKIKSKSKAGKPNGA
jgi:hypothetical protein